MFIYGFFVYYMPALVNTANFTPVVKSVSLVAHQWNSSSCLIHRGYVVGKGNILASI